MENLSLKGNEDLSCKQATTNKVDALEIIFYEGAIHDDKPHSVFFNKEIVPTPEPELLHEFNRIEHKLKINPWLCINAQQVDGAICLFESPPDGYWMRIKYQMFEELNLLEIYGVLNERGFSKLRQLLTDLTLQLTLHIEVVSGSERLFNEELKCKPQVVGAPYEILILQIRDGNIVGKMRRNKAVVISTRCYANFHWRASEVADVEVYNSRLEPGHRFHQDLPMNFTVTLDNGIAFECNKLVLERSGCPRIERLVAGSGDLSTAHFPQLTPVAFALLRTYLYGARISMKDLSWNDLIDLFQSVEAYQLHQLRDDLEDLIVIKSKKNLSLEEILKWYIFFQADPNIIPRLASHFMSIMARFSLVQVFQSDTYKKMEQDGVHSNLLNNLLAERNRQHKLGIQYTSGSVEEM